MSDGGGGDAKMCGCWMVVVVMQRCVDVDLRVRNEQPICLTSTYQKTLFSLFKFSLKHLTQDFKVPINPFSAKTLKPIIVWSHKATMALKGLIP